MKQTSIYGVFLTMLAAFLFSGCYKLQTNYKYNPSELDPHYDYTAKEYLLLRGTAGVGSDTVFKWMQLGLEYAGFDMTEFEKPGRTYIFLHNNAIKTVSSGKVTAGFFFDYPIVVKDATGTPIKSKIDPTMDSTRPANSWNEYSVQTVKNYFLYLILQGEYGFDNLGVANTSIPTLLPPNTTVSKTDTKLGWVVTKTTPNPDLTAAANVTFDPATGKGFDPEGLINLRLTNNDKSPINVNDRAEDRTAGYYLKNGRMHVYDKTVPPFRYSYP